MTQYPKCLVNLGLDLLLLLFVQLCLLILLYVIDFLKKTPRNCETKQFRDASS